MALIPRLWLDLFTADPKAYEFGVRYLTITAPFYGLFWRGSGIVFREPGNRSHDFARHSFNHTVFDGGSHRSARHFPWLECYRTVHRHCGWADIRGTWSGSLFSGSGPARSPTTRSSWDARMKST